jgi:hypothetical protein
MSAAKRLALVATGYVLAIAGGLVAVGLNELFMPADVAQSSGMVAFGDMILFFLVAGFLGLAPTWFLLTLFAEKAPRILLAVVLLVAALGPASWLAVTHLARAGDASLAYLPQAAGELLALFLAFVAFPRMVLGPALLVVEAAAFLLLRARVARTLLATAMLMDVVPLGIFAFHVASAMRY